MDSVSKLKSCLIRFPETGWNSDLGSALFSEAALIQAISELLREYGKFPVPWNNEEPHNGLWVVGTDDRFIGHWEEISPGEGGYSALSIASEDLGDANMASRVIIQTYFRGLLPK